MLPLLACTGTAHSWDAIHMLYVTSAVLTWLQNGAAAGCCMTWFRTLRQRYRGCPCLRAATSAGERAKAPPLRSPLEPCVLPCLRRDAARERKSSHSTSPAMAVKCSMHEVKTCMCNFNWCTV